MRILLGFFLLVTGCRKVAPIASSAAPIDLEREYQDGKTELGLGRLSEAIAHFEHIAKETPDPMLRANAWLALGSAYADKKDPPAALATFEKLVALRPDDPDAWRVLTVAAEEAKQDRRQMEALERLIALEPDDLKSYLDLAGLKATHGDIEGSKKIYLAYERERSNAVMALGKSTTAEDRAAAAASLASAKDVATARALVLGLTDRAREVRLACARSLAEIGAGIDKEIATAVKAAAEKESDPEVRAALSAADAPGK